jgi:AcrR family transcriptional regulator
LARTRATAEVRKREIIENFYEVLAEEGLEGASIAKVASRMGVYPSLLIHHFSNKEEMVVELVDFLTSNYEQAFLPKFDDIRDPEERLSRIIDSAFGPDWFHLVDNGAFYACYALSFRNERVRAHFQRMYQTLRDVLVAEITAYAESGKAIPMEPGKAADLAIIQLAGFNYYKNVFGNEPRFGDISEQLKYYVWSLIRQAPFPTETGSSNLNP